ncbi:MAG: tetratricopeptide repeat protein [Bryobacteraceae bacterium]|jgi:Tfp pilus assembly protein PilF
MPGIRMRQFQPNFRTLATAGLLAAVALLSTGCDKLKARDNINSGTAAFKAGNFAEAADHFKLAQELDPKLPNVRIYLATAYLQQYIPGTNTPENKKYAQEAMEQLQETLKDDPNNLLATEYVANIYYQMNDFPKAEEWNKKVTQLDPKNKEAYYTLGVIPWTNFFQADRAARFNEKMRPEDPGPLKDAKEKAELKEKYWGTLTQGLEDEKKALAIDPEYENAMAYMNLLIRYRADLDDTKEQYEADIKEANDWVDKNLQTMKIKAARKAANPNAKQ